MRNRAKCRLCGDIVESKHRHDFVTCGCGEISVDGGNDYHRAVFNNQENFICIDDEGNEIIPKYKEPEYPVNVREELLKELEIMGKNLESLPPQALYAPVNHADLGALIGILHALFQSDK